MTLRRKRPVEFEGADVSDIPSRTPLVEPTSAEDWMSFHRSDGNPIGSSSELFETLERSSPEQRADILLRLLGEDSAPLSLPATGWGRPALCDIDLSPRAIEARRQTGRVAPAGGEVSVSLRGANLEGANMRGANLSGVDLRGARLTNALLGGATLDGALLEEADLAGADLAGARLREASLSGANLAGAMLEDAELRGGVLRFARLTASVLEGASLEGADLWGADLAGADLAGARLTGAVLKEAALRGANLTGADLRDAELGGASMEAATLVRADLRGARLSGTRLDGAVLTSAILQDVDLTPASIERAWFGGARMDRTRLTQQQLGGGIGEEFARDYPAARLGYLALERTFAEIGDPDAASWAYGRRRRMQKLDLRRRSAEAFRRRQLGRAAATGLNYVSDQLVEWLCDYGESVLRVAAVMALVAVAFAVLYGVTGSVMHVVETPGGPVRTVTHDVADLVVFSLLAMSTSGTPAIGLEPSNESVYLITAVQAMIGIALTGLLGFVLGNRIRR